MQMTSICIFTYLLFDGVTATVDCNEVARKYCPGTFNKYVKHNNNCSLFSKFHKCFDGRDRYCSSYFQFHSIHKCAMRSQSCSKRNHMTFFSAFISASVLNTLTNI
ncbi:uncharacterized protein LOC128249822 [Octopus bimaculoides]|uniref:uncharacterized protein LOC128249822 n=1 Tax=Octopus bimaculoides TaxID=37653 RepID=UPI0022DFDE93|nr:uncharacterized protein LOC128249822 [Octopus bimaculoides]